DIGRAAVLGPERDFCHSVISSARRKYVASDISVVRSNCQISVRKCASWKTTVESAIFASGHDPTPPPETRLDNGATHCDEVRRQEQGTIPSEGYPCASKGRNRTDGYRMGRMVGKIRCCSRPGRDQNPAKPISRNGGP